MRAVFHTARAIRSFSVHRAGTASVIAIIQTPYHVLSRTRVTQTVTLRPTTIIHDLYRSYKLRY